MKIFYILQQIRFTSLNPRLDEVKSGRLFFIQHDITILPNPTATYIRSTHRKVTANFNVQVYLSPRHTKYYFYFRGVTHSAILSTGRFNFFLVASRVSVTCPLRVPRFPIRRAGQI